MPCQENAWWFSLEQHANEMSANLTDHERFREISTTFRQHYGNGTTICLTFLGIPRQFSWHGIEIGQEENRKTETKTHWNSCSSSCESFQAETELICMWFINFMKIICITLQCTVVLIAMAVNK